LNLQRQKNQIVLKSSLKLRQFQRRSVHRIAHLIGEYKWYQLISKKRKHWKSYN